MIKLFGLTKSEITEYLMDKIDISNLVITEDCLDATVLFKGQDKKIVAGLLQQKYPQNIYSFEDKTLSETLAKLVIDNDIKFSVAESLTGGLVACEMVNISGISAVFMEGIVTYSNASKHYRLGVDNALFTSVGAVSEEVAKAMVEGQNKLGVRLSMSTTGIAGPTGDTPTKPIGLTYIGTRFDNDTIVNRYVFKGDRVTVRNSAKNVCIGNAIVLLKKHLNID